MQSIMRNTWLTLSLALGIAVCGTMLPSGAQAVDLEELKMRGKVVVGTEAAWAPFEFVEDGQIVGYDKDLLDLIIAEWGIELEQLDVPFAGILASLDQGKFDFVCTGLLMNPERAVKYAFTSPVALANVGILKKAGNDRITSVEDLSGLVIGAPVPPAGPTAIFETYNKELEKKGKSPVEVMHFQGDADLFLALANGQIDGAVEARLVMSELMKKQPDKFEVVGDVGDPFFIGWVTRKEDTDLRDAISEALRKIRDSGKMAELQMKWFGFTMEIPDSGYLPPGAI
jgi:polar amino acid transport system substrate-binding protein